ncbi:MAG: single-stranded DNA-binding protein [Patescibacteria group bacterium]
MGRSVNKAILIGNLTRDPEMRYTPDGQAVCSFGLATNRKWKTKEGEQKEEVEFHNLVAWRKLAEICSQFLKKGSKVYLEGRLQTRSWEGKDGVTRQRTEVVLDDMVMLDSKGAPVEEGLPEQPAPAEEETQLPDEKEGKLSEAKEKKSDKGTGSEEVSEDEIPF